MTDEPTIVIASSPLPPSTTPTDERPWVRGVLAFALFVLLAAEVGCALWGALQRDFTEDAFGRLKDILTIVVRPTVALLGAVTGFYYGQRA